MKALPVPGGGNVVEFRHPSQRGPQRFTWWDDAVDVARFRAQMTGRRHRVRQDGYWWGIKPWIVEEV